MYGKVYWEPAEHPRRMCAGQYAQMYTAIKLSIKVACKTMADCCLRVAFKCQVTLLVIVDVLAGIWVLESEDSLRLSKGCKAVQLCNKWRLELLYIIICLQNSGFSWLSKPQEALLSNACARVTLPYTMLHSQTKVYCMASQC